MKIAICEDDANVSRQLTDILSAAHSGYKIVAYKTGDKLWFDCEGKPNLYDVIFLDIELPGSLSGLDAAKKLRCQGDSSAIIILTNYTKYALDGYAIKPLEYLVKPLEPGRILSVFKEAERISHFSWDESLNTQTAGGYLRVPYNQILYIESKGNYVSIHTGEKTHTLRRKIYELAPLCDQRFLSPHKSYLINVDHMLHIGDRNTTITMDNGFEIPVSRNKKNEFLKELVEYDRFYNNNRFKYGCYIS